MPTAIEYGLMTTQWHTQNGAGSGPPAQHHVTVIQPDVPPAKPADEWLLTGPLAALLLAVGITAAIRRRSASSRGRVRT